MKKAVKYFVALFLALGLPLSASAAIVTYELNREFSGGTPPAGSAPWLKATLEDTGLNQVTLTMDSGVAFGGLTGGEYVDSWYFNLNPFQVPTSYTVIDVIGTVTQVTPSFVENKFEADGDGYFDLMFAFAQSGTGRFNAGESIAYRFTGSGLDVSDFQYRSMGAGNSPNGLYTAAHVNGITGGKSGWITPVPVPLSLLLLGSGLIGVVAVRRRVDSGQPKQA